MVRSIWIWIASLVAVGFGVLTIMSGGAVLFNPSAQQAAGNYVAFVVWFNFLSGFAYIAAGIGLWLLRRWAVWLAMTIAGAILMIGVLFGLTILSGAAYETRTVAALGLRLMVWFAIAAVGYVQLRPRT